MRGLNDCTACLNGNNISEISQCPDIILVWGGVSSKPPVTHLITFVMQLVA